MGKRFPHVKWYCDKCNTFLNRQKEFDDNLDSWECTKCGYKNSISADQVFESEEEYQKSRLKYKCGHCNADLSTQIDFEDTLEVWLCRDCGYVNKLIEINRKTTNDETMQKQKKTAWEKAKPVLKKIGKGVLVGGSFVAAVAVSTALSREDNDNVERGHAGSFRKTKGHPILPAIDWSRIYDRDGAEEADRILDKVQRGELSVEQVERALNRPDIPPEKWRDFEDGTWIPDGWFD